MIGMIRDRVFNVPDILRNQENLINEKKCVEYINACEPTQVQREQARKSNLYKRGAMKLVWVSESDICWSGKQVT